MIQYIGSLKIYISSSDWNVTSITLELSKWRRIITEFWSWYALKGLLIDETVNLGTGSNLETKRTCRSVWMQPAVYIIRLQDIEKHHIHLSECVSLCPCARLFHSHFFPGLRSTHPFGTELMMWQKGPVFHRLSLELLLCHKRCARHPSLHRPSWQGTQKDTISVLCQEPQVFQVLGTLKGEFTKQSHDICKE